MSKKITVPFCYLDKSKVQVFDMSSCKRSQFQVDELLKVSQREDFAYFVILNDVDGEFIMHPKYKKKYRISFFTKDGQYWYGMLGEKSFLDSDGWVKYATCAKPVPLNHCVYKGRCEA